MHIPDGFLDPKMSGGLLGAALGSLAYCFAKVSQAVTEKVPQRVLAAAGNAMGNIKTAGHRALTGGGARLLRRMAEAGAWVFAAQMFNFPVQSGTSGHLIGGVFASVLLGPFAGAIVISAVLVVQSLAFGDGGLTALGANIINMAIIASLGGYYIHAGLKKVFPEQISIALAAWASVMLAALACALEIGLSGTMNLASVMKSMAGVHAIIGAAEALLTVMLVMTFRGMESK
ncbi:MAG: energy-coupling factor ABC transporter permease [Elusimicrobia bacterium]|nr:energy-coupling factor ABC transporter permease [Elusimicrobiota bacterium]